MICFDMEVLPLYADIKKAANNETCGPISTGGHIYRGHISSDAPSFIPMMPCT